MQNRWLQVILTVGAVIIEICWYGITTIWIFISQLVDNIIVRNTRVDKYHLQELNRSFKFSVEPQADRLESRVPL